MRVALWMSTTWLLAGMIIGLIMAAGMESSIFKDQVKAGIFQSDGVAYKIEKVTP